MSPALPPFASGGALRALPLGSDTALWFLTRGTGVVTLLLLTIVVALGVLNVRRVQLGGVPRFALELVHRNAALLAVAFLALHVLTSVLDPFAPIRLTDAIVPFISAYRPFWLGLGALSCDIAAAVVLTSLIRHRIGQRAWRAIHWLAYASWPAALVHALGTGSDAKAGWMLALVAVCVLVVLAAVAMRVADGWPRQLGIRVGALSAAAALPIGLLVWLPGGPLAPGWAKRAGTPASVLAKAHGATLAAAAGSARRTGSDQAGAGGSLSAGEGNGEENDSGGGQISFRAPVRGRVRQLVDAAGGARVQLLLNIEGERLSQLRVAILGEAIPGGGVNMTSSAVTLGTASAPHLYSGAITSLNGTDIRASLNGPGGRALTLQISLQLDPSGQLASGVVIAGA